MRGGGRSISLSLLAEALEATLLPRRVPRPERLKLASGCEELWESYLSLLNEALELAEKAGEDWRARLCEAVVTSPFWTPTGRGEVEAYEEAVRSLGLLIHVLRVATLGVKS